MRITFAAIVVGAGLAMIGVLLGVRFVALPQPSEQVRPIAPSPPHPALRGAIQT